MKTTGFTIAVGLGDAIFIAAALNAIKDKYDKIYINPALHLAQSYKDNGVEYSAFYLKILSLLFTDPKFIINDTSKTFPYITTKTLFNTITPILPRFSKELTLESNQKIEGEYVVVTTKVRQLSRSLYDKTNTQFLNAINTLSKKYKVVIIGEKIVEMNTEYKAYGPEYIYNIYDDLLKINNVIDLTIPKLGITVPEIENLKKDCSIMRDAKCVITFGCGGNFVLAIAVSNNFIGYRHDDYSFIDIALRNQNKIVTTNNPASFINMIGAL